MAGFVSGLRDRLGGVADRVGGVADHVGGVADRVGGVAAGAVGGAIDALPSLPDDITQLRDRISRQADEFKAEKMKMLEDFEREKKQMIRTAIVSRVESLYNYGMTVTGEYVKKKIKDPYMPFWVQAAVDELVDAFWPDVTSEVRDLVLSGVAPAPLIDHGPPPGCCGSVLAFFRYYLIPYDRSFWRQLYNPLFILFTLISLVPKYGIGSIIYILRFFILDCGDTFQMESYIVDFKALQFLTLGVVAACYGSIQYYVCVSETPISCASLAPSEEVWTLIIFIIQIIVIWCSFCLLAGGKRKGGFHHMYTEAASQQVRQQMASGKSAVDAVSASESFTGSVFAELQFKTEDEMGNRARRRLLKFLVYDLIVFILCLGCALFAVFANYLDHAAEPDWNRWSTWQNWKLRMTFFWIKALYGLLSFPFAVFKIPGLKILISHAKPTGYNPYGRCVVALGQEEPEGKCPWHANYSGPRHAWGTPA